MCGRYQHLTCLAALLCSGAECIELDLAEPHCAIIEHWAALWKTRGPTGALLGPCRVCWCFEWIPGNACFYHIRDIGINVHFLIIIFIIISFSLSLYSAYNVMHYIFYYYTNYIAAITPNTPVSCDPLKIIFSMLIWCSKKISYQCWKQYNNTSCAA